MNRKKMFTGMKNMILIVFLFSLSTMTRSQETNNTVLPVDTNVRIGVLKNGMRYYIRKNDRPENRVEMRLVVHAGSVLEDDDQQGIAHFIEHMCFNGTKHFEKNKLIEYLQSMGVKFGPEINAYTSFDETVYMLTLPADSASIINNGFQVMEDWAHNVTFDTTEINKERGVIIEEWRMGRGAFQRMQDKIFPVLLKGSKYADRLPIGKKEIIENVTQKTMLRFYHDWYRPDLMAFIIVGDLDVDKTEAKIKEQFGALTNPKKERKRPEYEIPLQNETLVAIATDKESPVTIGSVYYKSKSPVFKTYGDYREMVLDNLYIGMLNQRLSELKEKAEPPFINAGSSYGEFLGNLNAFVSSALVSDTGLVKGFKTILTELERVKQHGFTQSELDRYKKILLNQYQQIYNERDKTESDNFTDEYTRNFLQDEPIPGISFEYNYVKDILPSVSLQEVNALTSKLRAEHDEVIVVNAPEKEGVVVPDKEELLSLVKNVKNTSLEAYQDKTSGSELLKTKPEQGRILFTKKLNDIDAVEYKLSNGAKVILKKTDFKNDEILFSAESPGGQSLYPDSDYQSAANAAAIMNESGLGDYSKTDLQKLLAGKTVDISSSIGTYFEGLSGYSSPKDLESLMQLIYLKFTSPRKDKEAFTSYINKQKASYKNILSDPTQYFIDQYRRIKARNNIRAGFIPTEKEIDMINLDKAYEIYKDRFADASDFYFFFVGSFSADSIKPLIETYLASLPALKRNETWHDLGIRPPSGKIDTAIYRGSDPKSMVITYMEQQKPWNEKDAYLLSVLGEILDRKYIETLREQMSGVYGVQASAGMGKIPYDREYLQIYFPCSPENSDSLTHTALKEITNIQQNGISDEEVKTAREIDRRSFEENLKTNSYWLSNLKEIYRTHISTDMLVNYNEMVDSITSDEIKRVADEYVNPKKYLRAVLYPENYQSH